MNLFQFLLLTFVDKKNTKDDPSTLVCIGSQTVKHVKTMTQLSLERLPALMYNLESFSNERTKISGVGDG